MEIITNVIYNLTAVHPFHSLIVHFPIALISASLFFILLALWRRSDVLEQIAFANLALATISTFAAGVTGWLDNKNIYDSEAPNANVKIVLASTLFGITLFVSIARWRNPNLFHSSMRNLYVGGFFLSFLLVAVLGFLGGVILYGFHEAPKAPVAGVAAKSNTIADVAIQPTETSMPVVSFAQEVLPILKSRCASCHGGQKKEEGLDLTSYSALMTGSENGPVLFPGDAASSPLAQVLIEMEMPKRGPKLKPEQVQMLIDWINAGAPDN